MNLKNPKDKKDIQETLRAGEKTEFWHIITQALEESIEHIENELNSEDMSALPAESYKITSEVLKSRRDNLRKLLDIPKTIIMYLDSPDNEQENLDPYQTADEIVD